MVYPPMALKIDIKILNKHFNGEGKFCMGVNFEQSHFSQGQGQC